MFCAIVARDTPASVVASDEHVLAFCDLQPVHPGHLLVVPREHAADLATLPAATGQRMFAMAQRLAAALRASGLRVDGVNLFLADGAAAGQEVGHVHLHVVPRHTGDGALRIHAEWSLPPRAELDGVAERVRAADVGWEHRPENPAGGPP